MTYKFVSALCVFFLLPIFVFAGCGSQEQNRKTAETVDLTADFSSDFTAQYNDIKLKGRLSSNRQKLINIQITSPSSLDGIEFGYKSSELHIKRDDMVCSADEAYIPQGSFPSLIKEVCAGIADGRAVLKKKDNGVGTYELKTSQGSAVITANNQGKPQKFIIDDCELEVEFIH